jgi:DtxR family Mn-dependent transcriptional regulator
MAKITVAMEDYLRAIYVLGGGSQAVSTTALAEARGNTAGAVTGMLKRLAEGHLIRHEPYHGVVLTEDGQKIALEVLRHHRLIELYLTEVLGYSWDQVHEEADRLEHHISEEFEARIFAALGQPTRDPHGDPIPSIDGKLPMDIGRPLTTLQAGEAGTITRVLTQDAPTLRYLTSLGVAPQTTLTLVGIAPVGDPLTVIVGSQQQVLGRALASHIIVA